VVIQLQDGLVVGRGAELDVLTAALAASTAGEGRTVTLVGDPGIGKSRLGREVVRRARERGIPVLAGRAVETGPPEPYRPLIEALASGFRATGPPEDPSLLPHRGTLAHLVPTWARTAGPAPPVLALAEAVLRLLAVTARDGGALLVLEDLHWADDDLLALVEYLADNADAHGACCVLTCRPEPQPAATGMVRRLADRRAATLLELGPLAADEVDALVLQHLGVDAIPTELLTLVRDRSDGIPFLVEELLLSLVRSGAIVAEPHGWQVVQPRLAELPDSLATWLGARLDGLGSDARRVLTAAALLGTPVPWSLLPAVTGLDEPRVLAILRAARDSALLQEQDGELRFRHALTRAYVLEALLAPERSRLAERALQVVAEAHPDLPGHWRDLAADLAELAGRRALANGHLLRAADEARRRGALSSAAVRLERALELTDPTAPGRGTVLRRLAEVRALAGDVDGALTDAARAAGYPPPSPEEAIDVELAVGRALVAAGRAPEAGVHADRARGRATERDDTERVARATLLAASVRLVRLDIEAAHTLATEVNDRAELPAELRCEALELLGRCARLHDVAAAERWFAEGLDLADAAGLLLWRARQLNELGTIDLLDRMRIDRLEQARRAGIEAGAPAIAAVADLHLAAALVARGQPVPAREAAERAEALARRLGHAVEPWATMLIARTYAHERRPADAEAAITRALERSDDPALAAQAEGHVRTMLALHLAQPDAAREALDRAAVLLRRVPGHHDPHRGLWALLRTLAADDDRAARDEAARAAGSDTRYNRAMLAVADAVAAGRSGRRDEAAQWYRAGLDRLAGYERHDLLSHLTGWLVAPAAFADGWGDPVGWLQGAVRWFAEEGHDPLATACRTLLREAGARVPRQGRGTSAVPASLLALGMTSREVDVLALVGHGLTNPEIAARLVLSPRTVEKHVAALLRKAGVADRRELARLAHGLDEPVT
jgi:DNA-binding CsgD family transcriptional regulator